MKNLLLGLAISLAFIIACNPDNESPLFQENIIINTDQESLNTRISQEGTGVIGILDPNFVTSRISEIPVGKVPLVLVAQVDPPLEGGKILKATHVDISGNYAYVGYNLEGEEYLGAVEIYDISNVTKPKITSQAIFKNADISSLEVHNGRLYIAAAFDVDSEPDIRSPSQLLTVSVANGNFTSKFIKSELEGFVATGVSKTSNHVAVTSGSNGVIALFDDEQKLVKEVAISDLRGVKYGNEVLAVLSGTEGIHILNPENLSTINKIVTGQDIPQSKRTLDMGSGLLFASEGLSGAGIYKLPSGDLIEKLPINLKPEGVESGDIVTNAVSFDKNLLFMANGGAGVGLTDLSDLENLIPLGVLDISGSSNFVKFYNGHLFVATGAGGLQILELTKVESSPNGEIACEGTIEYTGNSNLNVNSNEEQKFAGSASFKNVNISGYLLYCGSMAVESSLNLNSEGVFEMNGSFAFGQFKKNTTLSINSNAILRISGSAVIYGDLNLNSGAKIEFVGSGNSITIYGEVKKGSNISITGDFTDTEGKLK